MIDQARKLGTAAGVALVLALAGCGGSDGDDDPITVVPGTPTPPPSPTPTPSPTPAPSPTPTPTAVDYSADPCDYSRDQAYELTGAGITATGPAAGTSGSFASASSEAFDAGAAAKLAYVANGRAATLTIHGTTAEAFGAADEGERTTRAIEYNRGNRALGIGCNVGLGSAQRYAAVVIQGVNGDKDTASGEGAIARILTGGLRMGATTATPTRSYSAQGIAIGLLVGGNERRGLAASPEFQLTTDASGQVRGTLSAAADRGDGTLTFTIDAQRVAGTALVSGTATSADGGSGRVEGGFFGPAGEELALVFTISRGSDQFLVYVIGR